MAVREEASSSTTCTDTARARLLGWRQRQGKTKHGTSSGLVFCPDSPLVGLHDRTRNGEPDAHAFLLGRKERVKNFVELIRRDPRTRIGDRNNPHRFSVLFGSPVAGPPPGGAPPP